jgi:alkyl sulfatase BDS1-like metallo-beta-lactamase superfamily hydrolase
MAASIDQVVNQGAADADAIALGDGIFMSRGVANSYLVTTPGGDLMINTGLPNETDRIKDRFARVSTSPLRAIVFTQGHPDHVGGWSVFNAPGVQTIAQANHGDVREYWRGLHPFYARRIAKLWGAFTGRNTTPQLPPEAVLTTSFIDTHAFELGGRRFELLAAPGGEATDGLLIWMPQSRTVFVGNLMGPMFGHIPNLYTIRGDKIRSAQAFLHSLDRVIALNPETLINGHEAFHGAPEIRATLTKVRDAMHSLRAQTIAGMNEGKDLWTLMREVQLPPELALPQAHGKVSWVVRAIWEEHTGWFRYESTTELYDVPPAAIWSDLVEIAGADALIARAQGYVAQNAPLKALHFTDMVLASAPTHHSALETKRAALEQLLTASGGENFSEVQWLRSEIAAIDAARGG